MHTNNIVIITISRSDIKDVTNGTCGKNFNYQQFKWLFVLIIITKSPIVLKEKKVSTSYQIRLIWVKKSLHRMLLRCWPNVWTKIFKPAQLYGYWNKHTINWTPESKYFKKLEFGSTAQHSNCMQTKVYKWLYLILWPLNIFL